jgi:hypothetical protein
MVGEETKGAEKVPAAVRQILYGGSLTEEERLRLPEAANIEGLKDEIATLRARLDTILREQPKDLKLALHAMNTLLRMVMADYRLSPRASKDLSDNVAAVLNSFADQLVPSDR